MPSKPLTDAASCAVREGRGFRAAARRPRVAALAAAGCGLLARDRVDPLHQEEDREGDDQELDHRVDEEADVPGDGARLLRLRDRCCRCRSPSARRRSGRNRRRRVISPIGGMMMSSTSEDTIAPNAAPIMMPIARSSTLPFNANSLNSFSIEPPPSFEAAFAARRIGDADLPRIVAQGRRNPHCRCILSKRAVELPRMFGVGC